MSVYFSEFGPQPQHCFGVQLRHARFIDAENFADFLHGKFVEVVEGNHQALFFRQSIDGGAQNALNLGFVKNKERIQLRSVRNIFDERLAVFVVILPRKLLEAPEIQSFDLIHQLIELFERYFHRLADFFVGGGPPQALLQFPINTFQDPCSSLRRDRGAQSRLRRLSRMAPFDAQLGIGFEFHTAVRIEFFNGVQQPEDACAYQIIQFNMGWQLGGNSLSDVFDLGQMLQNQFIPFRIGGDWRFIRFFVGLTNPASLYPLAKGRRDTRPASQAIQ